MSQPGRSLSGIDALDAFSDPVRTWFTTSFPAPTDAQAQGWPAIAAGDHTLILAPTGSGKTLAAFLWGIDRLMTEPVPEKRGAHPAALHLAAAGPRRRRREEPAGAAAGHPPGRRAPRRARSTSRPSASAPATPAGRAPPARAPPARPAHHHARVALPDAHVAGPGDAAQRRGRDRRRDPRAGRHQAGRPPGAHPRAARRPLRAPAAAHRPVGHPAPARGDRPLPRRLRGGPGRAGPAPAPAGHHRRRRHAQGARDRGRRPGRGHGRARRGDRGADERPGRGRAGAAQHLAGDAPPAARARPGAPLHADLRQRPPPGRAAGHPAQRAGRRARDRRGGAVRVGRAARVGAIGAPPRSSW